MLPFERLPVRSASGIVRMRDGLAPMGSSAEGMADMAGLWACISVQGMGGGVRRWKLQVLPICMQTQQRTKTPW